MGGDRFQRNTRQRQVILEELCRLTTHPTATELYELLRPRLQNLSLGTVYRNLDLLARMGRIRKLEWAGGEARFDGNTCHHDHVRCTCCGRVADVGGSSREVAAGGQEDFRGYDVLGYRLEFIGICPCCREQSLADTTSNPEGDSDHA